MLHGVCAFALHAHVRLHADVGSWGGVGGVGMEGYGDLEGWGIGGVGEEIGGKVR